MENISGAFLIILLLFNSNLVRSQDSILIDYKNDTLGYVEGDLNYNLIIAADNGNVAHAAFFINKGADVNTSTFEGLTPLFYAVNANNLDMVLYLITHDADLNWLSYDGMSPLTICANNNYLEIGELLIQHGANINIEDYKKHTPLHYSASNDYFYFTDMLIHYGANLYWKDKEGMTPLMLACLYGNYDIVELLLIKGVNIDDEDEDGNTPLILAVQGGDIDIVKLIVSYGTDINTKNYNGYSALSYAILNNNIPIAQFLLDNGANTILNSNSSNNSINIAKLNKNKEMEETLLSYGAKKDYRFCFNKLDIGIGASFSGKDFMFTSKFGIIDNRYSFALYMLYGTRISTADILVEERDNYYYQLREKRGYIGFSADKEINILEKNNVKTGLDFSISGLYSYSDFIGYENKSNNVALLSPGTSVFRATEKFYLNVGYCWMNFKTLQFPKNRIFVEIHYRFNLGKNIPENVKIRW